MKEELFNYTLKRYLTTEYLDTNPIRPLKKEVENNFWGTVETSLSSTRHSSYTPWGNFTYKSDYEDEKTFVKNYGNPLSRLYFNRIIICVTKEDYKVSFKIFNYSKSRRVAGKWFKVRTNCKFITFNYKTNALYTGSLDNYHLKRKCRKNVRRVLFNCDPINSMRKYLRDSLHSIVNKDTIDTPTIINQVISTFVNTIPGTERYADLLPEQRLYKRYLDGQGIKVSNNWFELMNTYPQPKKKDLVKCGYKYIDALMRVHGLTGDKIKRILHNVKSFDNVNNFENACAIFGRKFILNQSDEFVQTLLEQNKNIFSSSIVEDLTKKEISNFFEIYKLYQKGLIDHNVIDDHFRFYRLLKQMESIKWVSTTHDKFVQEHYDWSEKYNNYTNGDFTRIYNPIFIEKVNEVILTKDGLYFPEVLITSKRYNNESFFQSNCVKTYIKRVDSLLISMRRGEGETEERASIEYRITLNPTHNIFNLNRVQTLGKRNERLDNTWSDVLDKLDSRIFEHEGLFDTLQIEGEFNKRKVFSDYGVKEVKLYSVTKTGKEISEMRLCWKNDSIMQLNSYNYNAAPIQNWGDDEIGF
jgi:hypothetical protein